MVYSRTNGQKLIKLCLVNFFLHLGIYFTKKNTLFKLELSYWKICFQVCYHPFLKAQMKVCFVIFTAYENFILKMYKILQLIKLDNLWFFAMIYLLRKLFYCYSYFCKKRDNFADKYNSKNNNVHFLNSYSTFSISTIFILKCIF